MDRVGLVADGRHGQGWLLREAQCFCHNEIGFVLGFAGSGSLFLHVQNHAACVRSYIGRGTGLQGDYAFGGLGGACHGDGGNKAEG